MGKIKSLPRFQINPIADSRHYDKHLKTTVPGPVYFWEVKVGNDYWYIYHGYLDTHHPSIKLGTTVYTIKNYHFWKGTYPY